LADISKKIFETNRQRFRLSNEMLGGIKELKIMHLEQEYVNRFSTPSYILATTKPRSFIYNMSPRFILEAALYGGIVGTVIVLILVFDGRIEAYLPTVGLFGLATVRLLPAAQSLYYDLNRVRLNEAVFERVFQDLEAARRVEDSEPPVVTPLAQTEPIGLQHGIVFDSVDYSYPSASRGALNGLSLVIPAHSTVGIVGGTGAGKTTTVDLLLGLLTPQRGTIRLDDTVLDGTSLPAWRASIGYVPQQIFLGDESVAANIAFGVPRHEIDHAAVERAARIAELHDFIVDTLPDGYDTQVGERGVRLSGGQRQRIGIARALYRNPDVLILDEATSALDNITESRVMKSIQQMAGQKTIIMIAHRLTTVQNCDVIFLLENGRLAAQGGFEELKRRSPAFAAMVTSSEQGDTAPVDAVAASG
jgi:ABC-type multidrug transport system fused ATPase/permease subunit